ncbi:MAG: hypothetical protein JXR76_03000 [Deltaproteobacteria bacterium]|nr:hypothetical protein [Deltaproteobacteria bacterium]
MTFCVGIRVKEGLLELSDTRVAAGHAPITRIYGKPILYRAVKYNNDLKFAPKVACLAFDSTRISAADVGLPIDVAPWRPENTPGRTAHRFETDDFQKLSIYWQSRLRASNDSIPREYIDAMFARFFNEEPDQ